MEEVDLLDRVDRRQVVVLGVADHVGGDRDPVLQHHRGLRAVRVEASVADADERGRLLGEHEAGSARERLAVVVVGDLRQLLRFDHLRLLAVVDLDRADVGQEALEVDGGIALGDHLLLLEAIGLWAPGRGGRGRGGPGLHVGAGRIDTAEQGEDDGREEREPTARGGPGTAGFRISGRGHAGILR